jgi:hypothetical protein
VVRYLQLLMALGQSCEAKSQVAKADGAHAAEHFRNGAADVIDTRAVGWRACMQSMVETTIYLINISHPEDMALVGRPSEKSL